MGLDPLPLAKVLVCAFFGVLFLQSGFDKVTDRKGNLEWMTGHFAKSPFKNAVPLLLSVITLVELAAGLCSLGGIAGLFVPAIQILTILGPLLSCVALVMLFTGQRLAKDYVGAATLAAYFGVAVLGLIIVGISKLP